MMSTVSWTMVPSGVCSTGMIHRPMTGSISPL
jgi:hypothetical protein